MCDPLRLYTELDSERRELRGTGWESGSGNGDRIFSSFGV